MRKFGKILWGRPLKESGRGRGRGRGRARRDPGGRKSSDVVWDLVEQILEGRVEAVDVLHDVIAEGVDGGKTKFMLLERKAWKRQGHVNPAMLIKNQFAAVTPGRQIVLFGVKERWESPDRRAQPRHSGWGKAVAYREGPDRNAKDSVLRGYISRYKIGDVAEYGGYNLTYFGKVTGITAKRVTVSQGDTGQRGNKSFDIEQFSTKNWDPENVQDGLKRNREWSD